MIKFEFTIFSPAEMIATARYLEAMAAAREEEPGPAAIIGSNPIEPKKPAKVKKPEPEPIPEPLPKLMTLEELRARIHVVNSAGKKEQVKDLLGGFGVAHLTSLAEIEYEDFLKKAEAL